MKIIIVLFAAIFLLNLSSCSRDTEGYSIKDALKISAFIFDENSGEDYYIYDGLGNLMYNDDENVYKLEQLKMNEVKIMRPLSTFGINLSIRFEFDGIIEIISENSDVQMFVNPNYITEPITGTNAGNPEPHGFEMKFPFEGFIAANPLGSNLGHIWVGGGITFFPHSVGREYYLKVNAYKFDNEQSAVIRARLRLVQLEDKTETDSKSSRCFSIELISYEYSDIYRIMDEIEIDENDD